MTEDVAILFRQAAHLRLTRALAERTHRYVKGAIEALLFAAPAPMSLRELTRATQVDRKLVRATIEELQRDYSRRGIQLCETVGGFTFFSHPRYGAEVRAVTGKKPMRMSRAQLETLAIVAYRQPVTRPEIDEVRGVDSGPVLRVLLDRELLRVLGKKEEPGRPLLYGTTDAFLKLVGLTTLSELPTLREFTELTDDSKETYERKLGESAPTGAISFDDEPDAPIDPTKPLEGEEPETSDEEGEGAGEEQPAENADHNGGDEPIADSDGEEDGANASDSGEDDEDSDDDDLDDDEDDEDSDDDDLDDEDDDLDEDDDDLDEDDDDPDDDDEDDDPDDDLDDEDDDDPDDDDEDDDPDDDLDEDDDWDDDDLDDDDDEDD